MKYILTLFFILLCATCFGGDAKPITVYNKYNQYQGQYIPSTRGYYNFYNSRNQYQFRIGPMPSTTSRGTTKGPVGKK